MKIRSFPLSILPLVFFASQTAGQVRNSDTIHPELFPAKKISYGLQAGTMFTSSSGYGSSFCTFISPHLTYPITHRFRISAGISIINTSLNNLRPYYYEPSGISYNGNFTSAIIFLNGQYQMNQRLLINGTVFKEIGLFTYSNDAFPYRKQNAEGIYFNADYKVTEHFHIQAGFGYSKGLDPCGGSVFQGSQMGGYYPYFRY